MIKATVPVMTDQGIQEFEVEILHFTEDFLGRKYVTVQALPVDRKIVFPFKYSDFSGPFTSSHTTLLADCLKNVVNLDTDPVNAQPPVAFPASLSPESAAEKEIGDPERIPNESL